MEYIGRAPARAAKSIAQCVGLKELEINLCCESWSKFSEAGKAGQLWGHKDFLRIRGLEKLQVSPCTEGHLSCHQLYARHSRYADFIESIRILKQPHDPRVLKRQETKDFP